MVKVELVYINSQQLIVHLNLELASGSTVADALNASGIYLSHPETRDLTVGIYAKQVAMDTVLKSGDRIEFYRPLALDPKENRRQRAHAKK